MCSSYGNNRKKLQGEKQKNLFDSLLLNFLYVGSVGFLQELPFLLFINVYFIIISFENQSNISTLILLFSMRF